MLAVVLILVVVVVMSITSEIHALGVWLLMMVTHNFVASLLGSSAEHMPLLAGLIIMVTIVARKKWTGVPPNVLISVVLLFGVMTLTAIAGLDPARSLMHVLWYFKGIVLAVLIAGTIKTEDQIRCIARYCVAGVLLAVCVTFFEYFTDAYLIEGQDSQRAGRFTGNPNDTATLMLIGLPLAVYWATHSKNKANALALVVLVALIVGAVALTQSRGGFVALLLILIALYAKKPSIKTSVFGVIILSMGLLLVPPESDFWKRMGTLVGGTEIQDGSINKRKHYVQAGFKIILKEPVLGVGAGNFGTAMIAIDPTYRENDKYRVAHNMYLEFFVENGIFGGMLFLVLLGTALAHPFRYDMRQQSDPSTYGLGFCLAVSLLALLFSGLFDSIGKSSVLWFFVGLGFACVELVNVEKNIAKSRYDDTLPAY